MRAKRGDHRLKSMPQLHGFGAPVRGFFRLKSAMKASVTSTAGRAVNIAGRRLLRSSVMVMLRARADAASAVRVTAESVPVAGCSVLADAAVRRCWLECGS